MGERLKGKVALIAGAGCVGPGWGNGRASAVIFAQEGAKVFAVDRDAEAMRETVARVRDGAPPAEVLAALAADGILINMSRGSVVDEPALIQALQDKTILSAGLDVYAREPHVSPELIAIQQVVLFPHVGSASVATREKMDQLVVDNLLAWVAGKPPLTPVPETPWPATRRA